MDRSVQMEGVMSTFLDVSAGVATLTLSNPRRLNAYDRRDLEDVQRLLLECAGDNAVRVLVVAGEGRAFCAGADLAFIEEIRAAPEDERRRLLALSPGVVESLATFPKPTVAAVHGVAFGGGACLALACDLVLLGASAQLGLVFTDLGLPGGDSCAPWLLSRRSGTRRAWHLMATAARLAAPDALSFDLADQVVADEDLDHTVAFAARDLAARSPAALQMTKRQILRWERAALPVENLHALEQEEMLEAFGSEALAEGLLAHRERRAPAWTQPPGH
jgi:enoyl-CoA hydratase/carnithine racemase